MVGRWGMSEAVGSSRSRRRTAQGPLLPGAEPVSRGDPGADRRGGAADRRRASRTHARGCCASNREQLDSLAEALLERETLDEDDAYAAAGIPREREPAAA